MIKNYLFAGASSKTAIETAKLLKQEQHKVFGISTHAIKDHYDVCYNVANYESSEFPSFTEPLNGLVYFPGTIVLKPFNRLSESDFLSDYKINALGAASFIKHYLENLKASQKASIVLISTVAVGLGMPFHSSISMAKGAIEGLTRALAAELAPNIRVNCIAPSLTNTPLGEKFLNTPEKLDASQKRNPLKKIGEALDLANAIEFLLSENSSWITGQVLSVDGGMKHLKVL